MFLKWIVVAQFWYVYNTIKEVANTSQILPVCSRVKLLDENQIYCCNILGNKLKDRWSPINITSYVRGGGVKRSNYISQISKKSLRKNKEKFK